MKNAVYFQSGGPTAVINSSFYGVIKGWYELKETNKDLGILYGSLYGVNGLINNNLVEINKPLEEYNELTKLNGAILGTARKRINIEEDDEIFQKIINTLLSHDIKYVLVNGGNDSMDTAWKLNQYFLNHNIDCVVVGIPKTIDNDLVLTDHCPGFGSNAKFIVRTLLEIFLDINSYEKGRVTIVEIMGRDTGWLCASSICCKIFNAAPDLIYVPEAPFKITSFLSDVKRIYEEKGKVLVCVSEALKDKSGNYVSINSHLDSFGHVQFGSVSKFLIDLVNSNLNYNTRNIELSLTQRSASHLISKLDQKEAIEVGYQALKYAIDNQRGMVAVIRDSNNPYQSHMELVPLEKVKNEVKFLPKQYLTKSLNYIDDSFIDYVRPFIDEEEIKIEKPYMFLKKH